MGNDGYLPTLSLHTMSTHQTLTKHSRWKRHTFSPDGTYRILGSNWIKPIWFFSGTRMNQRKHKCWNWSKKRRRRMKKGRRINSAHKFLLEFKANQKSFDGSQFIFSLLSIVYKLKITIWQSRQSHFNLKLKKQRREKLKRTLKWPWKN